MKKSAHYRRAVWLRHRGHTITGKLVELLRELPGGQTHEFQYQDGLDGVVNWSNLDVDPLHLWFITYERGAPVPIVPEPGRGANLTVDIADPPDGSEYIQSQLFCVMSGNDLVWTSHNSTLREGPINALFHRLLLSLRAVEEDTMFALQAILDRDAFETAFGQGIQGIDLGVGDFRPVLETLTGRGLPAMRALESLVYRRLTAEQIEAASDVSAKLILRPGKRWSKPQVMGLLSDLAGNVLEQHEEEFVIETKSGLRLTKSKMSVHKDIDVLGDKRLLNHSDVKRKLAGVLADLEHSGLLDE